MRTRLVIVVATLTVGLALSGCDQAKEIAQNAASSAASAAASSASQAAVDYAQDKLCDAVADGKLSDAEVKRLKSAADAAERAGVPSDLVDQAKQLADQGTDAPQKKITEVQQKCAAR